MSDSEIKVTDWRMFTTEGELREEYRFLEQAEAETSAEPEPVSAAPEPLPPAQPAEAPVAHSTEPEPAAQGAPLELPSLGPGPSFMDLVAMLAEPIPIYFGDAVLPDGSSQEDLAMARLHIDLLEVLRRKTVGNLSVQESGVLESILYQVRSRFIQKQG